MAEMTNQPMYMTMAAIISGNTNFLSLKSIALRFNFFMIV